MKRIINFLSADSLYLAGIVLILFSAGTLTLDVYAGHQNKNYAWWICYLITAAYTMSVFGVNFHQHRWNLSHGKLSHTSLLLILWFISAFALNLEMNVFNDSTDWLSVWIFVSSLAFLLAVHAADLPSWLRTLVFLLLGGALVLFVYYAVYLVPLYIISVVGLIAVGISLHTYIPLFLTLATVVLLLRAIRQQRALLFPVLSGIALLLIFGICFLLSWGKVNKQISLLANRHTLKERKLPLWVSLSQSLEPSFLNKRLLKSGLVYQESEMGNLLWGDISRGSFGERKQHDPLVMLATLLFGKPSLDEEDRIQILKSMFQGRHQVQERLWAGDQLETVSVVSNIKLFPSWRMAYTEKILSIRNQSRSSWSQQEGLYTFHLPEGAVVSALSLWIAGVEEQSRLTTKAKADSAYHEIVGVEVRDPSVVHWQEGNTVVVRVFPCTPEADRKFKIGITSPLAKVGDRLVYQNPFFDGPLSGAALETVQLGLVGPAADLQVPASFEPEADGTYLSEGKYDPDLEISCKAPALSAGGFSFAGASYRLEEYRPAYRSFDPKYVYLDVNGSWSAAEFELVWHAAKGRKVYVFDDGLKLLTEQNRMELFRHLTGLRFSLFPVQEIRNAEESLLVAKSNGLSPNLADLEGSVFGKEMGSYLSSPKHITFYNIGSGLSPYLKALKELRVLDHQQGSAGALAGLLSAKRFVQGQEDENTVLIGNARMLIRKVDTLQENNAPDHLLRLFAYNDIMKKAGPEFFTGGYVRPELIAEAEQAHIVSPVSSMIVLESRKDYEHFDIEENKNSLKNASMKSSGAVPEPGEWLLIILCAGVVGYVWYSRRFNVVRLRS